MDKYISVIQLASFLNVTGTTIRRWARERNISLYRLPGNRRTVIKQADAELLRTLPIVRVPNGKVN